MFSYYISVLKQPWNTSAFGGQRCSFNAVLPVIPQEHFVTRKEWWKDVWVSTCLNLAYQFDPQGNTVSQWLSYGKIQKNMFQCHLALFFLNHENADFSILMRDIFFVSWDLEVVGSCKVNCRLINSLQWLSWAHGSHYRNWRTDVHSINQ